MSSIDQTSACAVIAKGLGRCLYSLGKFFALRITWETSLLGKKKNTAEICEVFTKYGKSRNFASDWVSLWWIDYSRLYLINPHDLCVHCHSKGIIIPN